MNEDPRSGESARQTPDAASAWAASVRVLPVGTHITGEVTLRVPFGVFLSVDGHPDALGLAEVASMPSCMELPAVGEPVSGEVVGHTDHNRQVRVALGQWVEHRDRLPSFRVGQVVVGRIVKITSIGVFFDLDDCFGAGLVPLADTAVDFREGQVAVRIVTVDHEQNRILLVEPVEPELGALPVPTGLSRARHEPADTA